MAIAETQELVAELNLRGDFARQGLRAQRSLGRLNLQTRDLNKSLTKIGQGLTKGLKTAAGVGAGAVAFLAFNVVKGVESLAELEDVTTATSRVIKSTGGVANVTAGAVRDLSERYEDLTTVDDKVIQGAANLLLTFTNVRRRAFEPTIAAALDMAEALDMDVNSAVRTLGRALNDPAQGLSRLTRLGVTFTEQERKKVVALQASGRTLEAQRFILGRLNRLYGGRAKTAASGYRGSLNRLKDSAEELQQALAGPLIRPLTRVANKLAKFAKTKDVQDGIKGIGEAFASLFKDTFETTMDTEGGQSAVVVKRIESPFTKGLALVKEAFETVRTLPWDTIRTGLQQTFQVAAKAVELFKGLPPELQTALITLLAANKLTGGLVASGLKDIAAFALKSLTTIMAGNVTVVAKSVTGPGSPGLPNTQVPGGGRGGGGGGSGGGPRIVLPGAGATVGGITPGELKEQADRIIQPVVDQVRETQRVREVTQGGNRLLSVGTNLSSAIRQAVQTTNGRLLIQQQLNGKGNNLLDQTVKGIEQTENEFRRGNTKLTLAQQVQNQAALRMVPLLGGIQTAAKGTRAAVLAKDYNLRVSVTTNVSATTVAQGVNRVTSGNRVVYD